MKMTKDSLLKIIGAADEVISALADTNDEVHKDDTDKMVRLWDGLNDKYAPPKVVRELARMALGAMDSEPVYQCEFTHAADSGELQWHWEDVNEAFYEQYGSGPRGRRRILYSAPQPGPVAGSQPVAYTDERNLGYIDRGRETAYLWGKQNSEDSDVALYRHAQPAPVVQDNSDPRDAFEDVFPMPTHVERCGMGYVVTAYSAWTAYEFVKKWEGWNACRAAMLNGGKS